MIAISIDGTAGGPINVIESTDASVDRGLTADKIQIARPSARELL
jgi:hypothetical protein